MRVKGRGIGHEPMALMPGPVVLGLEREGGGPLATVAEPASRAASSMFYDTGPGSGILKGDNRLQDPAKRSNSQAEAGGAQELDSSGHREAGSPHPFTAMLREVCRGVADISTSCLSKKPPGSRCGSIMGSRLTPPQP